THPTVGSASPGQVGLSKPVSSIPLLFLLVECLAWLPFVMDYGIERECLVEEKSLVSLVFDFGKVMSMIDMTRNIMGYTLWQHSDCSSTIHYICYLTSASGDRGMYRSSSHSIGESSKQTIRMRCGKNTNIVPWKLQEPEGGAHVASVKEYMTTFGNPDSSLDRAWWSILLSHKLQYAAVLLTIKEKYMQSSSLLLPTQALAQDIVDDNP
ncbi:hypothetical protein STEG23_011332, partial [Scotinomys teguina]